MGRGRGKGKRQSFAAAFDDITSGEDDKVPARRRGRPQKHLKDKTDDGKTVILEEEDYSDNLEGMKSTILSKNQHHQAARVTENGMKRKRPSHVVENEDSVNVHNVIMENTNDNELINVCAGYRPSHQTVAGGKIITREGLPKLVLNAYDFFIKKAFVLHSEKTKILIYLLFFLLVGDIAAGFLEFMLFDS